MMDNNSTIKLVKKLAARKTFDEASYLLLLQENIDEVLKGKIRSLIEYNQSVRNEKLDDQALFRAYIYDESLIILSEIEDRLINDNTNTDEQSFHALTAIADSQEEEYYVEDWESESKDEHFNQQKQIQNWELNNLITDKNEPNIWKLGTTWGKSKPSFYEFIKSKEIVITEEGKLYSVGDIVIITQNARTIAITRVLETPKLISMSNSIHSAFAKYTKS